jgi:transposase-like protein
VRKWVKKIERCIIAIKPQKKHRDTVAVDETKVKVNPTFSTECYRYKELLAYRVSNKKHHRCSYTAQSNAIMLETTIKYCVRPPLAHI